MQSSLQSCIYAYSCTYLILLRVACYGVLMLGPGGMALFAPDCRSWGSPARGSSWRSGINPCGIGRPFVVNGNLMASRILACMAFIFFQLGAHMHESPSSSSCELRMVLLCLLCVANHGIFICEQPRQSLLYNYFRWQWLQNRVCWVSCVHLDIACSQTVQFMHTCIVPIGTLLHYRCIRWLFG